MESGSGAERPGLGIGRKERKSSSEAPEGRDVVRAPTAPLGTNGAVRANGGFSLVNGGSPKGVELPGASSTCLCLALEIPVDLVLLLLLLLLIPNEGQLSPSSKLA